MRAPLKSRAPKGVVDDDTPRSTIVESGFHRLRLSLQLAGWYFVDILVKKKLTAYTRKIQKKQNYIKRGVSKYSQQRKSFN